MVVTGTKRFSWIGLAVAAIAVAAVTGLIFALNRVMPPVSMGVLYLLAVLLVSSYWGLWLGILTSVASALAFDYFHIGPTGELTISQAGNAVALLVYVVVAIVVSALANAARTRAEEAERRGVELVQAAQERDRLEEQLVETKALRRSDELKTALLRSVSHDLRSPLTGIATAAAGLTSSTLREDERVELAEVIGNETARLSRLVDNLLAVSRLQAGVAEPNQQWCSIEEVVEAAVDSLGRSNSAAVDFVPDPDLPLVQVDPAHLERVIANLLDNALRYSADKPVSLRSRVAGDRLLLRVTDHGPGIPQEKLEQIFEPFYREEGGGGSGLGLAIARGFVEVNGGRLRAESLPGQGSSFIIELPLSAQ